jgi:hypothetical protein
MSLSNLNSVNPLSDDTNDYDNFELVELEETEGLNSPGRHKIKENILPYEEKKKTNYIKFILRLFLHILIHISMLSILEIYFFFYYVAPKEEETFLIQMETLISLHDLHENDVRTQPFYQLFFEYYQGSYIDNWYLQLEETANEIENENNKLNNKLHDKAMTLFYINVGLTVTYYILFQYYYRKRHFIYKVLIEHLMLVMCIGLYEFWFFTNIILNYRFLEPEQLMYYLFSCYWEKVKDHYSEMNTFEKNITIECIEP